ncbi:MAG TPA: SDR family NAD(P)-dependent oxidoreductase [Bryobacteraceae bacterium]
MKPNGLKGRVAVVTGSSRGLGKAMAVALADEGARVALVSRSENDLEHVADEIAGAGGEAAVFVTDVASEQQVRKTATRIIARFGTVNILINNAGLAVRKPVTELAADEWRAVMETNVSSAFLMCHTLVPYMKGQGYGRILNIASTMASVSLPNRTAYSASKSALLGFTRSLSQELAADRITVNTISPGLFATELARPITENPEMLSQFLANIPLNRPGNPEEVGQLAVYLCSEAAGYITGADILIDGGWTAR